MIMTSALSSNDLPHATAAEQRGPAPSGRSTTGRRPSARGSRAQRSTKDTPLQRPWQSEPTDSGGSVIRLLPVPNSLPPFDDELPTPPLALQPRPAPVPRQRPLWPTSALPGGVTTGTALLTRAPAERRTPRTVADASVPSWSEDPDVGIRRSGADELPNPVRVGQALSRALAEVMGRTRPVAQLRAHCAPGVFAGLQVAQPFSGPTRLSSVKVSTPADGVAEVCAVLRCGPRARALAFRLEGVDRSWRITALQVG
jgi:hypothetical protein